MREMCPYSELVCSVFSRIRTEYGEISVSLRVQSKCGKIRTRITPNTDTFYTVRVVKNLIKSLYLSVRLAYRSYHQRCSMQKGVLRKLTKFTEKHLYQSLFFNLRNF